MKKARTFSVHPQMIFSLIKAQAGSLGKAVLENIMNSIDAQATKVDITVDQKSITIVDDGHGFRSLKEIEDCFEVFGFPHDEGTRLYGQFGIGRAQLWSFASAVWTTNTFKMDVDIQKRGLDYALLENQPNVQGLTIVSKFYKRLTSKDLSDFVTELENLALFAQVPVTVNGRVINKSPSEVKWDFETEDAWIKVNDTSSLVVYNLGVLVRSYPAYQVGSGGLVVTKPGVRLSLNMARNDILVSECKVWARIKPFIQKKADEKVRVRKERLSSSQIANFMLRYMQGEVGYEVVKELKTIKDVTGRMHSISQFLSAVYSKHGQVLTMSEEASSLAQRAHMTKQAFVLHPDTLDSFGFSDFDEWVAALVSRMQRTRDERNMVELFVSDCTKKKDLSDAVPSLKEGYDMLADNELTPQEKATLVGLDEVNGMLVWTLRRIEPDLAAQRARKLRAGVSQEANAWTDSHSYVALSRDSLKRAKDGLSGFQVLVNLLVHEYLHDQASTGSHVHDELFYKRYHDTTMHPEIAKLPFRAYRRYVKSMLDAGLRPSNTQMQELTYVESLEYLEPNKKGKHFGTDVEAQSEMMAA